MAVRYKIDVMKELKKAGFSTYRIQKENLLSNSATQKIRTGEVVSAANLSRLCSMLQLQPGDILEFVPDAPEASENMD